MITRYNLFWPISLITAIIFQGLFFQYSAGLNYAIFTILLLGILRFYIKPTSYSPTFLFLLILHVTATTAVIFAHTTYSLFIYWIFTTIMISVACYSKIKHLQVAPLLLVTGLESIFNTSKNRRSTGLTTRMIPIVKFIFLPLVTIIVLLGLYSFSNPLFSKSVTNVLEIISRVLEKISFPRLFFSLLGLAMAVIFIGNTVTNYITSTDTGINHHLIRVKSNFRKFVGLSKLLLRKKQVAIVAFIILNLMIAWLNYLDIENIWINFTWDGGFLKGMVHEGTNVLILAILISIGITLFYLSSNLVFMKNNRLFYGLVILWLIQNILMAVSVSIRNTIYIEHFSLAFKRIFVYFFLLACIVGLLSIVYKIIYRRSISFLVSVNSLSVALILVVSACFNWDKIIAKYNFHHYKESFVHYTFLVKLNNSALPYLIKSEDELNLIYSTQSSKFPFVKKREYESINYQSKIDERKTAFLNHWKSKSILEWNYPEARAYIELSKQ